VFPIVTNSAGLDQQSTSLPGKTSGTARARFFTGYGFVDARPGAHPAAAKH